MATMFACAIPSISAELLNIDRYPYLSSLIEYQADKHGIQAKLNFGEGSFRTYNYYKDEVIILLGGGGFLPYNAYESYKLNYGSMDMQGDLKVSLRAASRYRIDYLFTYFTTQGIATRLDPLTGNWVKLEDMELRLKAISHNAVFKYDLLNYRRGDIFQPYIGIGWGVFVVKEKGETPVLSYKERVYNYILALGTLVNFTDSIVASLETRYNLAPGSAGKQGTSHFYKERDMGGISISLTIGYRIDLEPSRFKSGGFGEL